MTKSRGINKQRRLWTEVELRLLVENYADSRTQDIATVLERGLDHVYAKAKKLGLHKSEEYLASPAACRLRRWGHGGEAYRFPKGHVPANKGLRRPGWSAGRMRETQFKPGESRNRLPFGSYRITADGYLVCKVAETGYAPTDWKAVHRLVWEAAHGLVLKGQVVRFKEGRRTTELGRITLDALELLTLAQNMKRNRLPPELQRVAQLRGVITRMINKRAKQDDERQEHQ